MQEKVQQITDLIAPFRKAREKVREEGTRGSFLSKEKGLPEQSLINLFGDIRIKVPERSR